jgi:hypothetical protein
MASLTKRFPPTGSGTVTSAGNGRYFNLSTNLGLVSWSSALRNDSRPYPAMVGRDYAYSCGTSSIGQSFRR